MNICFEGKETYEQIVERASKIECAVSCEDNSFIVYGDNFIAMAAMLPYYKGKIDLVYIDPPFNTDQVFSISDNRISTVSRSRNGKIAYADIKTNDDFFKFMYDRFVLIRELL